MNLENDAFYQVMLSWMACVWKTRPQANNPVDNKIKFVLQTFIHDLFLDVFVAGVQEDYWCQQETHWIKKNKKKMGPFWFTIKP